jgi:hypothetical protein
MYEVTRHLWRTKDGRLVPTGHIDAQILAYARHDHIPDDIAAREGLILLADEAAEVTVAEFGPGDAEEPAAAVVEVATEVAATGGVVPVPAEVAATEDVPPPVRRAAKRAARKKVSGVTINRTPGGSADG